MTSDEEGDASEQDYGDDEEEDDHVSLASDVEDQDDLTDADEDEEMQDGEKKSLVVKLPVKTPTPERKTFLKLRLAPEPSKSPGLNSNTNGQADSLKSQGKENTLPASVSSEAPESLKRASTPPAVPISVPSASRSPLAFRGSPEKPNPFTPSIDVGYGGS
jgi:hypothetical protein